MNRLHVSIVIGFILLISSGLLLIFNPFIADNSLQIEAPNFTIQTIDNENISLLDFVSDNKIVLIDFMATWCNPCLTQDEYFLDLLPKFDNFVIISMSLEPADTRDHLLKWTKAWGSYGHTNWYWVSYEAGVEKIGYNLYNTSGFLPTMIVIDSSGFIRHNQFGIVSQEQLEIWFQLY